MASVLSLTWYHLEPQLNDECVPQLSPFSPNNANVRKQRARKVNLPVAIKLHGLCVVLYLSIAIAASVANRGLIGVSALMGRNAVGILLCWSLPALTVSSL